MIKILSKVNTKHLKRPQKVSKKVVKRVKKIRKVLSGLKFYDKILSYG